MTDQEALRAIAAVTEDADAGAAAARADCGAIVHQLHRMTAGVDIEALGDGEALELFSRVVGALEASDANVFGD